MPVSKWKQQARLLSSKLQKLSFYWHVFVFLFDMVLVSGTRLLEAAALGHWCPPHSVGL